MITKQKPLLPSLKEKKRYLVYEVLSSAPPSRDMIKQTMQTTLHWFLGALGMAKAGILLLDSEKAQHGIIRVNRKYTDHVKAALCYVHTIHKTLAIVKSVGLSGTLRKARLKFIH